MPTAQDLDTLRALLAQLQTVSSFQPGELIRAADWNTLAGVVARLAQAVLAADSATTVPPHQHLNQVDLGWLTPQLSALLQRGSLADPAAQNRFAGLEQKHARLQATVDATTSTLVDIRKRVSDVSTNDLVRQTSLTTLQRVVADIIDPGPEIAAMRASLDSVQGSISAVQKAAAGLVIDGKPLDLGDVAARLATMEQFRDSFRSATGQILDGATLEERYARIEATAITQDQLTNAFQDHGAKLPTEQIDQIETRLGTTLQDRVNEQLQAFQTEVQSNIATRFAAVGDLIAVRVNEAMPGLTQTLTASLNASIAAAQRSAIDTSNSNALAAIAVREQVFRADVQNQLAALNAGLSTAVGAEVKQQLGASLQQVQGSVSAIAQRLETVTAAVAQQGATLQDQARQLASVPQTLANIRNDLQKAVLDEMSLQVAAVNRSIADQFAAFRKTQADQFSVTAQNLLNQATSAATQAAATAGTAAANAVRAQIVAEMQSVAQQQATAIFNAQMKTAVTSEVKEQFAALPGLVANEVQRFNRTVTPIR